MSAARLQPVELDSVMDDSLAELVARRLRGKRVVLAVSGGRDSMALLHAAATHVPESVACVASFDHATGAHSARALALVEGTARALGVAAVSARASTPARTEAEWRAQRWSFLRHLAREHGAQVATAHSRDDQIETVLMRTMRGAGARGLAALAAVSSTEPRVIRPMLDASRAEIADYAAREGLVWEEDPSNARPEHLRNRIRHELLPALSRANPSLAHELFALGARAAALREEVERFVDRELAVARSEGAVSVDHARLRGYDATALALLWPAIAARAGVTLDRRGTARLAEFTTRVQSGARVQLSGGFEALSHRGHFIVRRSAVVAPTGALVLSAGVQLGSFRFDRRDEDVVSLWSATLPSSGKLTVRTWHPGDRMVPAGGDARRVKGLLRDAGVDAASRGAWPVVLADDEIVWVPGVRRSSAASARSGRPVVTYHCERIDR